MKVNAKLVTRRKAQKNTGSDHCPERPEIQTVDSICFQKMGAKNENLKEVVENGILSVKTNGTGVTSVCKKWKSEKHNSWGMSAEGFKGHVATDGSLLGNAGNWGSMWLGSGTVGLR